MIFITWKFKNIKKLEPENFCKVTQSGTAYKLCVLMLMDYIHCTYIYIIDVVCAMTSATVYQKESLALPHGQRVTVLSLQFVCVCMCEI